MLEKKISFEMIIKRTEKRKKFYAHIFRISKKEALKKAFLTCFGLYLLALISSFIPIIHFIAVPLLVLFGPLVAFFIFKTK